MSTAARAWPNGSGHRLPSGCPQGERSESIYFSALGFRIFKDLEVLGDKALQVWPVFTTKRVDEFVDGLHELGKVLEVSVPEAFGFDQSPDALNQVEVGRVRRQEQQLDPNRWAAANTLCFSGSGRCPSPV